MKKPMKVLVVFLSLVIAAGLAYIGAGVWMSSSVCGVVGDIAANKGYLTDRALPYVDPGLYEYFMLPGCFDGTYPVYSDLDNNPIAARQGAYAVRDPVFLHWFGGGIVLFRYDSETVSADTGEWIARASGVPVAVWLEFRDWRWVITDIRENPSIDLSDENWYWLDNQDTYYGSFQYSMNGAKYSYYSDPNAEEEVYDGEDGLEDGQDGGE